MTACANCGAPFTPVVSGQTLCDKCHGLAHPEPASPLQHAEVAGYRLAMELGAGRFAHTWLAEDAQGRPMVLKLLRRYAPDPNTVQRFLAEAQRAAGAPELDHPNIARPVNAGVHLVSAFFLVYQSGGELTLADELRQRGRVIPPRALEFCAQVAEGLASAHRAGLLHLDLKPANIGVTKAADGTEQAVVLDVATAYLLAKAGLHDAGPLPLSSAAYISPEEAAGKAPDARSDLYSLGVVLFQLISGRLPMMGATAHELLKAHREHPPLRLRDVGRRVHADLESLIARLLSKDPAQRPASGDEVAVMMRAIAPIADTAPMEEGGETVDDPIPVVAGPRPDPEVIPAPPQMLPPQVDPALERAMMGEVGAQPPDRAPGIPHWAPFVPPRWWPLAAAGAAVLALVVILVARAPATSASKAPKVAAASPVALPPRAAPAPVVPAAVAEAVRVSPPPPPKKLAQAAPSPYGKNFERAQKALWTGQPDGARSILQDLLRKPLSKRDRARASKMMGDAEAKKGNRAAAAAWYKKSLKLFEDPDDRDKVSKLLAGLR
ncbi:MAG: serine/threonine protein kinase [Deltaproteobacteria bacterium]|nr:MAG: serine/threonine protein kinase [Deltaproteobacteria bacterium]